MLEIALHNPRQHSQFQHTGEPLVLARTDSDSSLWTPVSLSMARAARVRVQIELSQPGVELTKVGCEVVCDDIESCDAADALHLPIPAHFSIGDTLFEIVDTGQCSSGDCRPLEKLLSDKKEFVARESSGPGPSPATISRWFSGLGSLNRSTNSLQELYIQAAQCAVESIGLDGAMVLRRRDLRWEIAASHLPLPEFGIHCDVAVLDKLLQTPETLFHGSAEASNPTDAENVQPAVVVSPLRNAAGNLVGAIYGFRSVHAGNARRSIRYLEANLIELLAAAVSEAIARLERESEVDRRRVLLEQAFAASEDQNARRMVNEQREVTMLFADLRGFTELADSLEMEQVYELLSNVMDCLTAAVMDHDGMVIDYYGDGLAAMWNAPADQAEHPELACRAAIRMLSALPEIAADWNELLPDELRIGIGIHTGTVQVGNAGSKRRTKYGPRGPEVHLASRVETATKELGVPLVITQATAERLSNRFTTHRLCRVRMRGLQQPIDLCTISPSAIDDKLSAAWNTYARALESFEAGRLSEAVELLRAINLEIRSVPVEFLSQQVERGLGRQKRRRNTDNGASAQVAVITLIAK
jgi:adenylate cyclase